MTKARAPTARRASPLDSGGDGGGARLYVINIFELISGRDAIHVILSAGIAVALIRFGRLERRALKDS